MRDLLRMLGEAFRVFYAFTRPVFPFLVGIPILLVLQRLLDWQGMDDWTIILISVGINVILAVSLNVVNGFTGQFSLGHAGFMAVGGYTTAKIALAFATTTHGFTQQAAFALALLGGMATAALAGLVVGMPSLRLRGDYLAIVTLGFGMIIVSIVENVDALGKAIGLSGLPGLTNVTWTGVGAIATVVMARRLAVSTQGRALFAIREDEVAAEAMGVDTTGYKVRAFVISAAFAGLAGGLIVHLLQLATPRSFNFIRSFEVVVMVVLGGLGSITGSVMAAILLTVALEALREFQQYRMVVYSFLLIVLMLTRPQGLFGTRELWDLPLIRRLPWMRARAAAAPAGAAPTVEGETPSGGQP
jgi:branched-chain amino acid transport system permease protein